jgi:2,4-dienoyl-CoA reductase-like NADH-dependent reductase (Old Yellow Enzyme family)/thioredoxin reductase
VSGAPRFPLLFSPLRIGPRTVKNRIVSTAHDTVMVDHGAVTDQLVAYQAARAEGGVGLIVVQVAGVHDSARYTAHALMAHTDDCIPGYRRLVDVAHRHGCTIFGQLFHGGREVMDTDEGCLGVSYAASSVPNERFRVFPRAMPTAMVREVVQGFGDAAGRLRRAGMDGVEVVASHGYLPAQFLNPRTNRRTDEYGGSFDNRLRFLREVLERARSATEGELAVGLRVSLGEDVAGLEPEETLDALSALEERGLLDYVSVTRGSSATLAGSDHIAPAMSWPSGYTAPLGARAKARVRVPVIVAGRLNQPQDAELVLARGDADAVGMTRALISDPTMPRLAEAGDLDGIRACIACNQACIGHFHAGYPISCIQRPETGRELEYGVRSPAARSRDVMVVGGGPAGLKAATVAAQRGHRVRLYEAGKRVGGQVLLAERLPGRAEFGGAVTNLLTEASRAGVEIVTGVEVGPGLVAEQGPEAVVVATGARPYRPDVELTDEAVVLDAWQVIDGCPLPSGRVLVADWRGDWEGIGTATLLAEQGRRVTLATIGYQAGESMQQYVRDEMLKHALRAGVDLLPLTRLYGADDDTAYLQHVLTEEPVLVEGITAVVLAQGHAPVTSLADALDEAGSGPQVHLAGDCLSPRTAEEAILEGLRVGSLV